MAGRAAVSVGGEGSRRFSVARSARQPSPSVCVPPGVPSRVLGRRHGGSDGRSGPGGARRRPTSDRSPTSGAGRCVPASL